MTTEHLVRASIDGGLFTLGIYAVTRCFRKMNPAMKSWLWRMVFIKFAVTLVVFSPIRLAVLPSIHKESPMVDFRLRQIPPEVGPSIPVAATFVDSQTSTGKVDWFMILWLTGAAIATGRLCIGLHRTQKLAKSSCVASDEDVLQLLNELCTKVGVVATPQLRSSCKLSSPMLVGGIHPSILLPEYEADPIHRNDLLLVLAHEIGHIHRRDLWWQLLASVVQIAFFFHPCVWLASRESYLEQESATDLFALELTKSTPRRYAEMLMRATLQAPSAHFSQPAILAIYGTHRTLKQRIITMQNANVKSSLTKTGLSVAAIVASIAMIPAYQLTEARSAADASLSISNAKQVCLSLLMYQQDYDLSLPFVQSKKALQYATFPYLKNMSVWQTKNPNGGEFLFAMNLAGVLQSSVLAPASTPMIYDSKPWPSGFRIVGFVDGHVKRVSDWSSVAPLLKKRYPKVGHPLPLNYGLNWTPEERRTMTIPAVAVTPKGR